MISSKISTKKDLLTFLKKKKYNKIFVISGKNSFYKSGAYKIIDPKKINKEINIYFKKSNFPEMKELIKITKILDSFNPELIVAIGGGCVLDYAKIANIVDNNKINNLKRNIINFKSIGSKKKYPLIAIPTTEGSGAETTSNAVIYINKTSLVDNKSPTKTFYPSKTAFSGRAFTYSDGTDGLNKIHAKFSSNQILKDNFNESYNSTLDFFAALISSHKGSSVELPLRLPRYSRFYLKKWNIS